MINGRDYNGLILFMFPLLSLIIWHSLFREGPRRKMEIAHRSEIRSVGFERVYLVLMRVTGAELNSLRSLDDQMNITEY